MHIDDFDDVIEKTNLRAFLRVDDIIAGKKYNSEIITKVEEKEIRNSFDIIDYYHFEVDDDELSTYYDVSIFIANKKSINRVSCDCKEYRYKHSCKHIGAVIYNYYNLFFNKTNKNILEISNKILDNFINKEDIGIKKELKVLLELNVEDYESYYYYRPIKRLNVKVSLGDNKLYALKSHIREFRECYESGKGKVVFGKNFTYDATKYYLSEKNEKLINAYFELTDGGSSYYPDSAIKRFLKAIKENSFIINNYQNNGIIEGFFVDTKLTKCKEEYELNVDVDNVLEIITDDFEYILYKGKLYHLNNEEQELLTSLKENELNKITITKDRFSTFTKGLLKVVKKNINIDKEIDDIIIPKDIKVELYFDLQNNYIIAEPKFIYDEVSIAYFDDNNLVLRDIDFESKVINELVKWGFVVDNNSFKLNDLTMEVDFLEDGLESLSAKYLVYTTENVKKVSIKKKTNISSMFKIGQDNILSYNFNLDGISSKEILEIFQEMKNKKKYYRLKSGDILALNDSALVELKNLTEDLEISDEEIINGKGSILKYRAIYLDSLKNTKYNIVHTDNLFDKFIDNFYKYKNAELTLAKEELGILRDYQLTGVKWLYNLDKTGFGGILADEMGLGKTIQVIYYIKQILKEDCSAKFLIVVPTSLAYNWEHEFSLYGNDVKRSICVGTKDKRNKILENLNDYNVIVTTYGLIREDEEIYQNLSFHAVILDEAQNIKNNMAGITKCVKKLKAETKFALTGTPLENNVLELWSIFDFLMPGYLNTLVKFQTRYKFKDTLEENTDLIEGLSKQIKPFILRRKKKDVVKELPDKLINDIYIDLGSKQKELYVAELENVKKEMEEIIDNEGISKARFLILQLLTRLRQLCIDPEIIYENYKDGSNKIDTLINIIKEYISNNHKILIFSSFKTALNIVKEKLNSEKIDVFMIDGSVPSKRRIEMVDSFNKDSNPKVFLIMLKSGGTGLNLTSADVVIHLDLWWNPQAENQATDRAHRIGQEKTVEVIHLIMKGTIEEKILELQRKKQELSDKLIDGEIRDRNILSDLSKEDIESLLAYENKD